MLITALLVAELLYTCAVLLLLPLVGRGLLSLAYVTITGVPHAVTLIGLMCGIGVTARLNGMMHCIPGSTSWSMALGLPFS